MHRKTIATAVLAALALAGCGTATTSTTASSPAPASSSPVPATATAQHLTCELWKGQTTITFLSTTYDMRPACDTFIRKWATAGELWRYGQPSTLGRTQTTCSLATSDDKTAAIVTDTTSELVQGGESVCAAFLATGHWKEQIH